VVRVGQHGARRDRAAGVADEVPSRPPPVKRARRPGGAGAHRAADGRLDRPEPRACHDRRCAMSHSHPLPPRRRPPSPPLLAAAVILVLLFAGACTAPIATPSPAPTTAPSAVPSPTSIGSAEEAAAAVLASDPRFAGLVAQDPNAIGQCCTWTATPAADGYDVTIEIGWGDCPAGCINRHHWFYAVAANGAVTLDSTYISRGTRSTCSSQIIRSY